MSPRGQSGGGGGGYIPTSNALTERQKIILDVAVKLTAAAMQRNVLYPPNVAVSDAEALYQEVWFRTKKYD